MNLTEILKNAKSASFDIASAGTEVKNNVLRCIPKKLSEHLNDILSANKTDIENAKANGMSQSMLDRLTLTKERIEAISAAVLKVVALSDPIGKSEVSIRPNGLEIHKVRVPLGVCAIIYEARPNVTIDAAVLCIKSGNAVVLKGGKEAVNTNIALGNCIREALRDNGLCENCVSVLSDTSRETANALMRANGYIDVLIPRGGKGLINAVVENASVPVIETGAGNCHVYVDEFANMEKAVEISFNARAQRPSVCNSAENLLVHEKIAREFLPLMQKKMQEKNVEIRGCDRTFEILTGINKATEEDFYTEYNDYILAVKVVKDVKEAVSHINEHGTKHSEAIITENADNSAYFMQNVDAAAVYVNASTRFTDGEEFGLGAEIGISTQKLHARGPMGLCALTTTKYKVYGNGQVRS